MNLREALARTVEVIRLQHKSLQTEKAYCHWLRHFIAAVRQMPNELSSEQKMERFLNDLALRDVSAATQNQAFNAIRFFYGDVLKTPLGNIDSMRAKREKKMRHAPNRAEVRALLDAVRDQGGYPTNLVSRMLYGMGMRVTEPLNLRVKDLDFESSRISIRGAKGGKDRMVNLPCSIIEDLRAQLDFSKHIWKHDRDNGFPVKLSGKLNVKYPEFCYAWPWAWVFPAHHLCRDPRGGEIVRYRMHEANVQRAIRAARRKLGIMVMPHELRHSFATHCIQDGVSLPALAAAMGHSDLKTTMGYYHDDACGIKSPLDMIMQAENIIPIARRA